MSAGEHAAEQVRAGASPNYTDRDLDMWWSALNREQRRAVLRAGIDSGDYYRPEEFAAGAPTAAESAHIEAGEQLPAAPEPTHVNELVLQAGIGAHSAQRVVAGIRKGLLSSSDAWPRFCELAAVYGGKSVACRTFLVEIAKRVRPREPDICRPEGER